MVEGVNKLSGQTLKLLFVTIHENMDRLINLAEFTTSLTCYERELK